MEVSKYAPGTFCWTQIGTPDAAAAKRFYEQIFGWSFEAQPMGPPEMHFHIIKLQGKEIGALYQMSKEELKTTPPCWSSFISVTNVDETTKRAKELGATITMEPMDVSDSGRFSFLQDTTGAHFGLWQAGKNIGARLMDEPGALTWFELATRDHKKAEKFYTQLFGWGTQKMQAGPNTEIPYTVFKTGERMASGMMEMTPEWGEIPPHWLVYFAVADCDKTAEKITKLKGKVLHPPTDIPNVGRFAVIQDPQGAVSAILKLKEK